ncbi:cytochrome c oxidase subunit 3 family protein [Thalassotalea piscium]|uniref:Nitric oxide reductase NorE protein n=1 Tax=Thalassotalea piscium TaxID=1230533 RepID=A0A7X0NEX9_9GAMM|nr:cytochrome c oxidase subunit 3 family protein [Thalassotalea piscium]MBB6542185.1 nitric oxide reductase NorE protein [Thalassotalea piscium]
MWLVFISMNSNQLNFTQISLSEKKLPGDLAMWIFILVELTAFALFFIGFAVTEQFNQQIFTEGKAKLHTVSGVINTIALITSSLFVAFSVNALHRNKMKQVAIHLCFALIFAFVYLFVKGWEYQSLFSIGIDIETNTFFTLYFLITAFHFLHVVLGMVILGFMLVRTFKNAYQNNYSGFESGACYWHMVDMLWIILFPLIYVI